MKGVYYVVGICYFVFVPRYLSHSVSLYNLKIGEAFISIVM
jgi:hypothetical protein